MLLLSAVAVFASCKKTQKSSGTQDEPKWMFEKLTVEKELFPNPQDTVKGNGMNLSIEFNYPSKFGNDSVLKSIQSDFILAFAGESYTDKSLEEAFEQYAKSVEQEFVELGSFAIDDGPDISSYFKHIATTVSDTTDIYITARTEITDYTGGAHGSRNVFYYNIDARDGNIFKENVLFNEGSEERLIALLNKKIEERNADSERRITILDPDAVKPNANFYFDTGGLVYVYNQYEIAPYSDGLIEVVLPYEEIEGLVNPAYEPVLASKRAMLTKAERD